MDAPVQSKPPESAVQSKPPESVIQSKPAPEVVTPAPTTAPKEPADKKGPSSAAAVEKKPREEPPAEEYRRVLPARMPESMAITLGVVMRALAENSLPLRLFEPVGTLQRMSEQLEYAWLLDAALAEDAPVRRAALVTAFAVASLAGTLCRCGKPFNPLLGETYTLDRWEERGWRYMAEQVSHNPDISAVSAQGKAGWALHGAFHVLGNFFLDRLLDLGLYVFFDAVLDIVRQGLFDFLVDGVCDHLARGLEVRSKIFQSLAADAAPSPRTATWRS